MKSVLCIRLYREVHGNYWIIRCVFENTCINSCCLVGNYFFCSTDQKFNIEEYFPQQVPDLYLCKSFIKNMHAPASMIKVLCSAGQAVTQQYFCIWSSILSDWALVLFFTAWWDRIQKIQFFRIWYLGFKSWLTFDWWLLITSCPSLQARNLLLNLIISIFVSHRNFPW